MSRFLWFTVYIWQPRKL